MTQKMVKNHKNYTGIFDLLPKMANFWPFGKCQTKIFGLFFTKGGTFLGQCTEVSKLLPERMALLVTPIYVGEIDPSPNLIIT